MTLVTTRSAKPKSRVLSVEEVQAGLGRGTDVLDPYTLTTTTCPFAIPNADIPSFRITEVELTRAKHLGQSLVLLLPITAKSLYDGTGNQLSDGGKLLYSDWPLKPEQEFGTKEMAVSQPTWAWMNRSPIAKSTGRNFLEHTQDRARYLAEQVYADEELPMVYQEAVTELSDCEQKLKKLMDDDWQAAAKQLAGLKLNELCCPTYSGLLYHWFLHQAINGERLYGNIYGWTRSLSAGGGLVHVGGFGSRGVCTNDDWEPGRSVDGLGAPFFRKLEQ